MQMGENRIPKKPLDIKKERETQNQMDRPN